MTATLAPDEMEGRVPPTVGEAVSPMGVEPPPKAVGTVGPTRAQASVLLLGWLVAVAFGMGLVVYGFGPFFHDRDQRGLLKDYRTEINNAAAAGGGLPGAITASKAPEAGDPVAVLQIESLHLEEVAVEGVGASQTKVGPGHVPGTAGPGQPGNSVIVGRRTAFGGPFGAVRDLDVDDSIVVTTTQGQSLYEVTSVEKLTIDRSDAADAAPLAEDAAPIDELYGPTDADQLTLITSASPLPWQAERATVVVAEMRSEPFAPTPQNGRSDAATGLDGDSGVLASVVLALLAYGLTMVAAVLLFRRLTPVTAYVLSMAPVLALTVIASETISRLFPAWM